MSREVAMGSGSRERVMGKGVVLLMIIGLNLAFWGVGLFLRRRRRLRRAGPPSKRAR